MCAYARLPQLACVLQSAFVWAPHPRCGTGQAAAQGPHPGGKTLKPARCVQLVVAKCISVCSVDPCPQSATHLYQVTLSTYTNLPCCPAACLRANGPPVPVSCLIAAQFRLPCCYPFSRGFCAQICSPGPDGALGRGMAAQMALREASRGASVLWVSPGPWGPTPAAAAAIAAAAGEMTFVARGAGIARRAAAAAGAAAAVAQNESGRGREQVEQQGQEEAASARDTAGHQRTPRGHAGWGLWPALWPLQQVRRTSSTHAELGL